LITQKLHTPIKLGCALFYAYPEPTPSPTPDPDAEVKAILYRFAFEGEDIVDTMFEGFIRPTNAELEFTEEGLVITVITKPDPYFYIPFPDGFLELSEYPYLKMFFKHTTGVTRGQFYIAFDGEKISGPDQHYDFQADPSEEWQEVIINLGELKEGAETITALRADILASPPLDSTITVDYIGFFATLEEAENYVPPNRR